MIVAIFIVITLCYLILIGCLIIGFDKMESVLLEDITAKTKFSIVIPFRNEAEDLPALLDSISVLNYPENRFEFILVNDDSSDDSVAIIQRRIKKHRAKLNNISIIKNNRKTNSPKKDAITSAINLAKNDWIVTTDADCVLPKFWLDSFDYFIQNNTVNLIVAPVTYTQVNSFSKRFQLLDFLSLQGSTIGGFGMNKPFLCNGANLAYKKDYFKILNGFDGNTDIASGDDIFLLEKAVKQNPESVHYLKCDQAIITTKPQQTIKDLISQRKRWAAKATHYDNGFGKLVGIIVLLMNAALICAFIFTLTGVLRPKILAYIFLIKFSIDFLLIYKTTRFYKQENYLSSYLFCGILYPFFSVYVACTSVFMGYKWKDRQFNK